MASLTIPYDKLGEKQPNTSLYRCIIVRFLNNEAA